VQRLVWFEAHDTREGAFRHERRIKKWNRRWKIRLIEAENPTWTDLFEDFSGTSAADQSQVPLGAHPTQSAHPRHPRSAHPREGGDPSGI